MSSSWWMLCPSLLLLILHHNSFKSIQLLLILLLAWHTLFARRLRLIFAFLLWSFCRPFLHLKCLHLRRKTSPMLIWRNSCAHLITTCLCTTLLRWISRLLWVISSNPAHRWLYLNLILRSAWTWSIGHKLSVGSVLLRIGAKFFLLGAWLSF